MPVYLTQERLGIIAITIAWIIWGAHPIAAKFGIETIPIYSLIFYRLFFATLILLPLTINQLRTIRFTPSLLKQLLIASLLGIVLNIVFFFIGLEHTQAIDAALIMATIPLITLLSARVFLKEKVTPQEVIGALVGLIGTGLIFFKPFFEEDQHTSERFLGNIFIGLAVVTWVAFTIYTKRIEKVVRPSVITTSVIWIGMIILFPLMVWDMYRYPNWIQDIKSISLYSMIYMTLGSTIGAYFLYEWGLKYVKAGLAGILSNISVAITLFLGSLVLGEKITTLTLAGALLLVAGVMAAGLKGSRHIIHQHHHKHKI